MADARFGDTVQEAPLVDYLLALFSGLRLGLVVPIGGPATQFVQRHRQALFPGTPMLIAGTDQRHVQTSLTTQDTAVPVQHEPSWILQNILDLLPQTTNIAVVIANSPIERFWLNELQGVSQRFTNQVGFLWLNGLSFPEMLKRCSALPLRSAVFYPLLILDSTGES